MSRPFTPSNKDGLHSDNALSFALELIGGKLYLATVNKDQSGGSTPTISTVTTADANWTLVATGLSGISQWRLSELNGSDFHYAYVAVPGNNFSVAFGWVGQNTSPSALYIKRPAGTNVTIKFERWV